MIAGKKQQTLPTKSNVDLSWSVGALHGVVSFSASGSVMLSIYVAPKAISSGRALQRRMRNAQQRCTGCTWLVILRRERGNTEETAAASRSSRLYGPVPAPPLCLAGTQITEDYLASHRAGHE